MHGRAIPSGLGSARLALSLGGGRAEARLAQLELPAAPVCLCLWREISRARIRWQLPPFSDISLSFSARRSANKGTRNSNTNRNRHKLQILPGKSWAQQLRHPRGSAADSTPDYKVILWLAGFYYKPQEKLLLQNVSIRKLKHLPFQCLEVSKANSNSFKNYNLKEKNNKKGSFQSHCCSFNCVGFCNRPPNWASL